MLRPPQVLRIVLLAALACLFQHGVNASLFESFLHVLSVERTKRKGVHGQHTERHVLYWLKSCSHSGSGEELPRRYSAPISWASLVVIRGRIGIPTLTVPL